MIDTYIKNQINESFVGILEAHRNMYNITSGKQKEKWHWLESDVYVFTRKNNYYIIIKNQFTAKQFEKRFTMLLKNGYELNTLFIAIDFKSASYEYIKNFKLLK